MTGKRHSEKTKRRMSEVHKGVKFDRTRRANMAAAAQRRERDRRAQRQAHDRRKAIQDAA